MTAFSAEIKEDPKKSEKPGDDTTGAATDAKWSKELDRILGPAGGARSGESGVSDQMREQMENIHKDLKGLTEPGDQAKQPDEKDVRDTQQKLEDKISKIASPEDQAKMKELGKELVSGNLDGFKKELNEIQDPEKKRAMVEELNKNLEGTGTRVQMDADGNVIVSREGSNRAVKIGADGKTRVVESTPNPDGTTTMGGEVLGADAGKAFKDIGNGTVKGSLDSNASSEDSPIPKLSKELATLDKDPYFLQDTEPGNRPGAQSFLPKIEFYGR
jgi:hypothetical protein